MSPRRSSRARTTQPSPALLQHTNSSNSSNSSNRERSTRSNHKNPSPQGSSAHRSQSIEDPENGSRVELPQTRQRQRTRGDDEELPREEDEDDLDEDEEEEVTRCLCGQQEYPGLPASRREALGRTIIKPEAGHPPTDSSDMIPDDIGSMFIQCDLCKVWQHGGCVGIMDEENSPDEYFCEQCRKDLHRIRDEANGYVHYLFAPNDSFLPATMSRLTYLVARRFKLFAHDCGKRGEPSKQCDQHRNPAIVHTPSHCHFLDFLEVLLSPENYANYCKAQNLRPTCPSSPYPLRRRRRPPALPPARLPDAPEILNRGIVKVHRTPSDDQP